MKPMTSDEIDVALNEVRVDELDGVEDISPERRMAYKTRALRAAFALGQDNGQAIILERAAEMFAQQVVDERVVQLGRSMAIILAWVAAKASASAGRLFGGLGMTSGGEWQASVMVAESEKGTGTWSHYQVGSTPAEALSKLATWCNEHDAKNKR